MMSNPRKFSEKIALHNQKQAEETAAFEAILRDVSFATKCTSQKSYPPQQHLQLHQNIGTQYRAGSLPNVNQMATNSPIDLPSALRDFEDIRAGGPIHNRVDGRIHNVRDRGRQLGPHRRAFPMDKPRNDCSPYGSAYLSPPPDTIWKRTNSDSAIHTSTMGPAVNSELDNMPSPTTPPPHRRIVEMVGENMGNDNMRKGFWDPKQMPGSRPKSCEVPNINIYPSAEQENHTGGVQVPITNNTGSLPDLTVLHFPPPLTTPLDAEDQNYGAQPSNLSPTSAHHVGMVPQQSASPQAQSPAQRRRPHQGGPSPLVLSSSPSQQMRMPHSPPVSVPNLDPSKLPMDPQIKQQFLLRLHQQQQRHRAPNHSYQSQQPHPNHHHSGGGGVGAPHPSSQQPPNNAVLQNHQQRVPQVCITTAEQNDSQPSLSHYRNSVSENCQSPTSPHSQPSYSPSQSPGLPPSTWNNFTDNYHLQHQQQTQALQHQFEQFKMSPDNHYSSADNIHVNTTNGVSSGSYTISQPSVTMSQAMLHGLTGSQEFHQQQQPHHYYIQQTDVGGGGGGHSRGGMNQGQLQQQSPHHLPHHNKIPDIVFNGQYYGGADDTNSYQQDFAKELGHAITGMAENFADDLFGSDEEVLKVGLGPLDFDGLQMLTDPNLITDPATEDSFKLEHRS
ncbi:CREB-regulated transcription coactivator 1-like isoform X4 [Crassostrea angulata]|uniref:CREB-regulated transcription coactivator 1 isoform X4 n=1 Tax=Magallana gigas TaxID=29159 RepID=UPI00148A1C94|nr:CREB-regulated transcription coactivator 1 isoform X4 [Crassostrea gigas]XP_052697407.1 CREB-regulated transcription coactivator 1-like isoform X4 [Crassostrea angulata]